MQRQIYDQLVAEGQHLPAFEVWNEREELKMVARREYELYMTARINVRENYEDFDFWFDHMPRPPVDSPELRARFAEAKRRSEQASGRIGYSDFFTWRQYDYAMTCAKMRYENRTHIKL
jgi:hypothetical protein